MASMKILFGLMVFCFCPSCVFMSTGVLVKAPQGAVRKEGTQVGKSIVLLRVVEERDGKLSNVQFFGPRFNYSLKLECADSSQSEQRNMYISPSLEAREHGWLNYVLEPGTYYLRVNLPSNVDTNIVRSGDKQVRIEGRESIPVQAEFSFYVPPKPGLIYVGTLVIPTKTKSFLIFSTADYFDPLLRDETAAAQAITQTALSQYGPLTTNLMRPLGAAENLPGLAALTPMGIIAAGQGTLGSPDWVKRAIGRTTGIGYVPGDELIRGVGGAGAGLAMLYLLYLPVGLTMGAVGGGVAANQWQPCVEGLARELKDLEMDKALKEKLIHTFARHGARLIDLPPGDDPKDKATRQGLKSVLEMRVKRVRLREITERGKFCVEIAFHARLLEAEGTKPVYDRVLLYSHPSPLSKDTSEWTENRLAYFPEARSMEAYCGPEGTKLFKKEVEKGMASAVNRVVDDLVLKAKQP